MILLSDRDEQLLTVLAAAHPQTIGLAGPDGFGKKTVMRWLAAKLLQIETEKLSSYPYYYELFPEPKKQTITIESLRQMLTDMTQLVPGDSPVRRIVAIPDADVVLRSDTQNALLKFIEEPPADTVVLLTFESTAGLLPTVISRLQTIDLSAPAESATKEYFAKVGHDSSAVTTAYMQSDGNLGLMHDLLSEGDDHALSRAIATAKNLLAADAFERLCQIDALAKEDVHQLLIAFRRIARSSLSVATAKGASPAALKRWSDLLELTVRTEERIRANAQTKLTLTDFLLQL